MLLIGLFLANQNPRSDFDKVSKGEVQGPYVGGVRVKEEDCNFVIGDIFIVSPPHLW